MAEESIARLLAEGHARLDALLASAAAQPDRIDPVPSESLLD